MIWFTCKKCGQSHGRGENLAGTTIFCSCGNGVLVPWASTTSEPETTEAIPILLPDPEPDPEPEPELEPRRPVPLPDDEETPLADLAPSLPRREFRRVNPAYCLNHEEADSEHKCESCRLSFCSSCVVTLEGKTLCAACKNFRIRGMTRSLRVAPLAILALIVGLVSGPVGFCLTTAPLSAWIQGRGTVGLTWLMGIIALLLPVASLVLTHRALRQLDARPHLGGRSLALTGGVAGLVGSIWCMAITLVVLMKQWSA